MSAHDRFFGWFFLDTPQTPMVFGKQMGSNLFYRYSEFMISICVIAILAVIALEVQTDFKKPAILIHALGYDNMREQAHIYHSLTGEWPRDKQAFEKITGMPYHKNNTNTVHEYIDSAQMERGAVSYYYNQELEKKIMTIRPAVTENDPLGPVIWVVGAGSGHTDWTIQGNDKSTMEPWVINKYLF